MMFTGLKCPKSGLFLLENKITVFIRIREVLVLDGGIVLADVFVRSIYPESQLFLLWKITLIWSKRPKCSLSIYENKIAPEVCVLVGDFVFADGSVRSPRQSIIFVINTNTGSNRPKSSLFMSAQRLHILVNWKQY